MGQYAEKYCIRATTAASSNIEQRRQKRDRNPGQEGPGLRQGMAGAAGQGHVAGDDDKRPDRQFKALAECMTQAKNAMTDMAQIHGIIAKEQAQDLAGRMNGAPEDPAFASDNDKKEKYGGMYR